MNRLEREKTDGLYDSTMETLVGRGLQFLEEVRPTLIGFRQTKNGVVPFNPESEQLQEIINARGGWFGAALNEIAFRAAWKGEYQSIGGNDVKPSKPKPILRRLAEALRPEMAPGPRMLVMARIDSTSPN